MTDGTAKKINICGKDIRLGDELVVRYTTGEELKDGIIRGSVTEIWSLDDSHSIRARLSCGWCFHDHDEIISHNPGGQ